jgi:hypothetical protein
MQALLYYASLGYLGNSSGDKATVSDVLPKESPCPVSVQIEQKTIISHIPSTAELHACIKQLRSAIQVKEEINKSGFNKFDALGNVVEQLKLHGGTNRLRKVKQEQVRPQNVSEEEKLKSVFGFTSSQLELIRRHQAGENKNKVPNRQYKIKGNQRPKPLMRKSVRRYLTSPDSNFKAKKIVVVTARRKRDMYDGDDDDQQ